MNKVLLLGNLTRDIELRAAGSSQVANIGLALNRTYMKGEEKREEVTFVDCEAWGKTAEAMAKHLSKGRQVSIEGRLKLDTWDDKETGKKQSKLKVYVEHFYFTGDKQAPANGPPRGKGTTPPVDADSIPFDHGFPNC